MGDERSGQVVTLMSRFHKLLLGDARTLGGIASLMYVELLISVLHLVERELRLTDVVEGCQKGVAITDLGSARDVSVDILAKPSIRQHDINVDELPGTLAALNGSLVWHLTPRPEQVATGKLLIRLATREAITPPEVGCTTAVVRKPEYVSLLAAAVRAVRLDIDAVLDSKISHPGAPATREAGCARTLLADSAWRAWPL
ncbi:MAG TPA: hypothetical protein VGQ42_15690 [Candidatus Dormibacteraeota bacterium]|jgi:hypothetical protein|nr:hypothetical protein [Candidatus Dormibacteraeota bacterium]